MKLILPTIEKAKLSAHARDCWPEEACALLVGAGSDDARRVTRSVLTANIADNPARAFEVDPAARLRLEKELMEKPEELIGIFHSHPEGPAAPSASDADAVMEPDLFWLIAAVDRSGMRHLAAFKPRKNGAGFDPVSLNISDS
ncbi:MAG: M67 family peptidase [Alphaproteobacteria bacterium]|nr:MAG: M67 family peptidase [Alphaproteobacteria bacterium]